MKPILNIFLFSILFSARLFSQVDNECDFFPERKVIVYEYLNTKTFEKSKIKYEYLGEKSINGINYRAYKRYINDVIADINETILVNCDENGLVIGNEIYEYRSQIVGEEINPGKFWDSTPVYISSMEASGRYYLPIVLKPNSKVGDHWLVKQWMHGSLVEVKHTLVEKNISVQVQNKRYDHVYVVEREFESIGLFGGKSKLSLGNTYYAKGVGVIKMQSRTGNLNIELVSSNIEPGKQEILNNIIQLLEKMPQDGDTKAKVSALKDKGIGFSLEQLNMIFKEVEAAYNVEMENYSYVSEEDLNHFKKLEGQLISTGVIDPYVVGTWKLVRTGSSFYNFYDDGIMEQYIGSSKKSKFSKTKILWRITNGNTLEILYNTFDDNGDYYHYKFNLKKHKDPSNGKDMMTFTFQGASETYIRM